MNLEEYRNLVFGPDPKPASRCSIASDHIVEQVVSETRERIPPVPLLTEEELEELARCKKREPVTVGDNGKQEKRGVMRRDRPYAPLVDIKPGKYSPWPFSRPTEAVPPLLLTACAQKTTKAVIVPPWESALRETPWVLNAPITIKGKHSRGKIYWTLYSGKDTKVNLGPLPAKPSLEEAYNILIERPLAVFSPAVAALKGAKNGKR